MTTTTFAQYSIPGSLFPESEVIELEIRSPGEAATKAPPNAYAFVLFDKRTDLPDVGPDFIVTARRTNESATYYLGGQIMDEEQVRYLPGDHEILISNMVGNGWRRVIRCRTGNWQPFEEHDKVIDL